MSKPKKDCSKEFHRMVREKRAREKQAQEAEVIKPVKYKIPEGRDNLKKRSEHFKKRRGNAGP